MLGDKDRVATPGGLPSVIGRRGGGEAHGDELAGMPGDLLAPLGGGIVPFARAEMKPAAESGTGETGKNILFWRHDEGSISLCRRWWKACAPCRAGLMVRAMQTRYLAPLPWWRPA